MIDAVHVLQAATDSLPAYRDFPVIGSRAAVWIAAEIHLMFAAFVLGVPMFAVVAEAIGIFGKDQRYDRLAKEFTRLLLIAYSATAIWGAVLTFLLATLYPNKAKAVENLGDNRAAVALNDRAIEIRDRVHEGRSGLREVLRVPDGDLRRVDVDLRLDLLL